MHLSEYFLPRKPDAVRRAQPPTRSTAPSESGTRGYLNSHKLRIGFLCSFSPNVLYTMLPPTTTTTTRRT